MWAQANRPFVVVFGCPPCLVLTCENKASAKEKAWPSLVCFGTDFMCSGWDPSQESVGEHHPEWVLMDLVLPDPRCRG